MVNSLDNEVLVVGNYLMIRTLSMSYGIELECLQRHEGVPVRPTPRCSP